MHRCIHIDIYIMNRIAYILCLRVNAYMNNALVLRDVQDGPVGAKYCVLFYVDVEIRVRLRRSRRQILADLSRVI